MEHYYALLLAGGSGARLWPLTETQSAKALLRLVGEHSLFRTMVTHLLGFFTPERICVIADGTVYSQLMREAPELPPANFIREPSSRDTTAAVGLGVFELARRDPEATVALISTDLHIAQPETLIEALGHAYRIAQQGNIVCIGIQPTHPAIGYGYIRRGEPIYTNGDWLGYRALEFTEKPDVETAGTFIDSGKYSWDSGIVVTTVRTLIGDFRRLQPTTAALLEQMTSGSEDREQLWSKLPCISLDYAILERAESIAVLPVEMQWRDVGTWDAIYDLLPKDEYENVVVTTTPAIVMNTHGSYIRAERTIAVIDVEDLVIVDTPNGLLICKRDAVQKVRRVRTLLRQTTG